MQLLAGTPTIRMAPPVRERRCSHRHRASPTAKKRGDGLDSLPFCKREERRVGPSLCGQWDNERDRGSWWARGSAAGGVSCDWAGRVVWAGASRTEAITKQRSPCVPRGGKALRASSRFAAALRVPGRIARAVGGGVMAGSSDPASSSVSPSGGRLRVAFAVRFDRVGSAIRQLDRRARELGVVHRMGSTSEVMRRRFSSGCVRGRRGSCRAAWRRRSAGVGPRGFSGCGRGCVRGP